MISSSARACSSVGVLSCGKVASLPVTRIVLRVRFSSSSKRLAIVWQGSWLAVRRRPALRVAWGERVALATRVGVGGGVVVLEEQLGPRVAQVPAHVLGEHADQQV